MVRFGAFAVLTCAVADEQAELSLLQMQATRHTFDDQKFNTSANASMYLLDTGFNVHIGNSNSNVKCTNVAAGVECAENAGDNNPYGDRFRIYRNGQQMCAKRLDANHGWGMNLQFECGPAEDAGDVVQVHIGSSGANTKCTEVGDNVECEKDAGDANPYGDKFNIHRQGNQMCAQRLDANHGWGMDLKFTCKVAKPDDKACKSAKSELKEIKKEMRDLKKQLKALKAQKKTLKKNKADSEGVLDGCDSSSKESTAPVLVHIGNSGANTKCANVADSVKCQSNAGDDNPYGDKFNIFRQGTQMCARRLDYGGGWGMDLKFECLG